MFRIHDLIQLIILEDTKGSELYQEFYEFAVELACAAFGQIEKHKSPESWPRCELLVPHIQSLTQRQDISSKAKKNLLLANFRRGIYLSSQGRYVEAESLYEAIIADREQLFGLNDLDTLNMQQSLAWVYRCRGRYVDAETLFKQVLESYKAQLGPEHRDTLATLYRLAGVYYAQQRFDDAETLLKPTAQSRKSLFGEDNDETLHTINLLAEVYDKQARYDEAESLLTRVLHVRVNLLGSEHRCTLNTKHALANVYRSK
jgi:tetratricopeptide (TPR) repeat protein